MLSRLLTAPAVLAVLLTPAADRSPGPGPRAPLKVPEITVVASEFAFTAPATVPAGPTAIKLVNRGRQVHHATLIRLDDGKTADDVLAAMKNPGPPPAWAVMSGGPNGVSPGGTAETIVDLRPGRYAVVCFVPDADGAPHVMKGMIRELQVTAAEEKEAPAAEPQPDIVIHMADYSYSFSKPITAGVHRVMVHDGGPQPHELVLFRLDPGKHGADFVTWAAGGMKTAPPGTFEGGVSPIAVDGKNTMLVNFRRGTYLLVCFLDDARDGKPHFMHGMLQEITVQ